MVDQVKQFSQHIGVDGVIICASTQSEALISQAAKMCRKRGRIILVGVVGLNLKRSDFYQNEVSFQVASSYGPGRYDQNYEIMVMTIQLDMSDGRKRGILKLF